MAGSVGLQTRISALTTDQVLLAANGARGNASIYNDSSAVLRILLSNTQTSSATVFTVTLNPSEYYELPVVYNGPTPGVYGGIVRGNWSAAVGAACVTEYS